MSRILLDTNILIYALDQSSTYYHWSRKFFTDEQYECFTTSKNLSEFIAVTTRGEEPLLSTADALEMIRYFRTNCLSYFRIRFPQISTLKCVLGTRSRVCQFTTSKLQPLA
ncbi:MAG: PIN domain-containing protein [Bdellovibrionales bacterium]|nr:PIN domain-containing protein [Bdellovibrionales bacterium]